MAPGTSVTLQVYHTHCHGVAATGRVVPSGKIVALDTVEPSDLLPAFVGEWDGTRLGEAAASASIFVFAATQPWPFDPRPWQVGEDSVLTLTASAAAQRWRDLRLWKANSGHTARSPVKPPIWEADWAPTPTRSRDSGLRSTANSAGSGPFLLPARRLLGGGLVTRATALTRLG